MAANADILQVGILNTETRAPSIEGPHYNSCVPSRDPASHYEVLSDVFDDHVGRPSEFMTVSGMHVFSDVASVGASVLNLETSGQSSSGFHSFENFSERSSVSASEVDG